MPRAPRAANMSAAEDRRKHQRIAVSFALEDVMELSALTMRESGNVVNLSPGGCGVVSEGLYPVGTILSFSFTLPNGKPITNVKGRIARASKEEPLGWSHGVVFEQLTLKNWISLRWYVMTHKKT